jgi:L-asparaginase
MDFNLVTPPKDRAKALKLVTMGEATVAAFRLFPGIKAPHLENILAPPVQGVVLECYGAGNAPARDAELMSTLARAVARGVVIVAVTQPTRGTADLSLYETGRALRDIGVVSGYDMTTEAALAKLYYLFEKGYPPADAARLAERNLRGELTGAPAISRL